MPGLSFFVNADGIGEEARRLTMAAARVHLGFESELRALADTIRRVYTGIARGEAPRRSGELGAGIKGEITSSGGGISLKFTSTNYTHYVIEGTGIYHKPDAHDVIRPKKAKMLRFEINGQVLYRAFVKGQKPNPFQERAWTRSEPGIQAAMKLMSTEVLLSFHP